MPSDEGKDDQVQQDKVTGDNCPFQDVIRLVIPSHITLLNTKFPFPSAKIHIIFVITKKNPRNFAGIPLPASQPPYPPCPKEDLEPLSKPLANRWQEDVTVSGGVRRPTSAFWYGSQACAPSGFAMNIYTSPPAPPLEGKG
jgi:hypothetical protein